MRVNEASQRETQVITGVTPNDVLTQPEAAIPSCYLPAEEAVLQVQRTTQHPPCRELRDGCWEDANGDGEGTR